MEHGTDISGQNSQNSKNTAFLCALLTELPFFDYLWTWGKTVCHNINTCAVLQGLIAGIIVLLKSFLMFVDNIDSVDNKAQ